MYSLIYDPDGKMWIFEFSLGVCPMELRSLVSSLGYLVSNRRQVLLGGIRLDGSATVTTTLITQVGVVGFSLFPKPNFSYLNFR